MINVAPGPGVPAEAAPAPASYRPDIDGLRALAISLVLGFHAFPDVLTGGYIGVDIFFVISGFLITGIILGPLSRDAFSLRHFYARRIRRLYPALVLVLGTTLAIGWFVLSPPAFEQLGYHTLGSAVFVPNLMFWQETGYFDGAPGTKPLLHLWSLGVEEQFYIAWPLVLYLIVRLKLPAQIGLSAVALASFVVCVLVIRSDQAGAFYPPFTRAWELALGGLLSAGVATSAMRRAESLLGPRVAVVPLAGLALIGAGVVLLTEDSTFPGAAALLPTLGTALIIAGGPHALVNRGLSWKPLVWLGLISYPLYLWHWPLLSFAFIELSGVPPVTTRLALLAAAVVLGALTYRLVERPFRASRLQGHVSLRPVRASRVQRWQVPLLVTGMVGVALAGWVVDRQEGFKSRYPISIQSVLAYADYPAFVDARAHVCWLNGGDFARECFLEPEVAQKDGVLVWGDSFAARLYVGVREVLGPDAHIAQFTRDNCGPILGYLEDYCQVENAKSQAVIQRMRPRTVLMFANWAVWSKGEDWAPDGPAYKRFAETLDMLEGAGVAKIIVFGPAPRWQANLPELLFQDWQGQREPKVVASRLSNKLDSEGFKIDATFRRLVESQGHTYVSLNDMLCNDKGCLTYVPDQPGKLVTWDLAHFTSEGATYVIRRLFLDGVFGK